MSGRGKAPSARRRRRARLCGLAAAWFLTASTASAGTHNLGTPVDNSANTTVPVTNLLMVTIPSTAAAGGNDATSATVSVGGTLSAADVSAIRVSYGGALVATASSPASLSNIVLTPLTGNQKGGSPWTFDLSLNAGAGGKTFNFTVSSIAGTNEANLPFTTATRTATAANVAPTVAIATPANGSSIGGPAASYAITGSAGDSDGSVTVVDVQLQRGTNYWNGSAWTASATWLAATGTTSWSYAWAWTNDMEATAVTVRARATDNQGAQTTATNTTTVDTTPPRIATGVRFQTLPTSGDIALTLLSNWTEANPGTPRFAYNLDNTGYGALSPGSAGNASTKIYAIGLNGSQYFTGIKSDHTDSFGNGPTTSEDLGPFYVLPLIPGAPTVANNGSATALNVGVVANPGELGTGMLYAIRCHDAGGTPTGFWVANSGRQCTAAAPDWRTAATWGSPVAVGGLSAGTTYGFSVAAGNPKDATPTTGERSASDYGGTASATTSSGNTVPTVQITSPTNGASFSQGAAVAFTGTATDAEDGTLTAGLAWSSSINGPIGSGGSFVRSDLAVGTHTITASVTDSGLLTGSAQVPITIVAVVNGVTVGTATASLDSCNQITVQAPFTGDSNGSSTTLFERSANGTTGWTAVASCGTNGVVGGGSPRVCVDTTVADNSVNYYRVDFTDLDGVSGSDPQVLGPYDTTPYCGVDGTTVEAPEAEGSSCSSITVLARFSGDSNRGGWTQVESSPAGADTWTVACAKLSGPSPRQCVIPALSESTAYDLRIDYTDGDGVTNGGGTDPQTLAGISTRACGGDGVAPTVLVLAPARGGVVTGVDRVKVQVHDAVGVATVQWSVDQTNDTGLASASANANYDCGTGCAVYEFNLDATALGVGNHYFTVKAADAAGNVTRVGQAFRVNSAGGDGRLLRRTRGAQLCIDCHNLRTHSSQATSTKYGNWAIGCDACHTPHKTRNLYLVREEIQTPSSGQRPVRFEATTGAVANSAAAGAASYVNEDNASQSDGPCQVCHTRTKSAGGQARWRNAAAGGNADSHYGAAATSRCMGCHTHDAGFSGAGGACDSCHNAPPTVGKHGSHDQVGTLPTAYDGLTSTTTTTQYGFACAKCHSGTHFSDATTPHTVEVSFDTTAAPANPGGAYAPDAGSQATDPGNNGDGWYWSNGSCSNVYCHSDADRIGGIAYQTPAPSWNQGTALTCTSCHDDGGATTTLSAAHDKHTTATTYNFGCVRCHDATLSTGVNDIAPAAVADKTQHVDGTRTVVFDPSGPDNSAGAYSQDPGYTCSNTYCHSNGQDRTAPYSSGPSIAWSATAALDCTSCHAGNATAATKMASGRHTPHVNNLTSGGGELGVNYECATCHSSTVGAGNDRAITGWSNHVDFGVDVSGTLTDNTYTAQTCNNAYCHSSGQATPTFRSVTWDTSTTLGCNGCHGVGATFGQPNYANGGAGAATANSHATHVSAATDCAKCHDGTTATGTSIKAGSALHTNQLREVQIAAGFDTNGGTSNYTLGNKTCGGVTCHGAGTPQWGATLVCLDCHTGTEGGALGDGTPNAVDDQWTADGHGGAAGGSLTSALGGCDYCHQLNAGHTPTDAANPYRLRFTATDNTLCLQCHAAGDSGLSQNSAGTALAAENSTKNVGTAHWGAKHAGTEGGRLCWDCHDPHGVPTNILMVKPSVSKASDTYGVPATTVTVTFTDNTTAGQAVGRFTEATNNPRRGICQACHDPNKGTDPTTGSTKYWRSDGTDAATSPGNSVHNAAAVCSTCHAHTDNFKGKGGGSDCIDCHGGGQGDTRAITGDFSKQSHHVRINTGGFGSAVTGAAGGNNSDCVVCHSEGQIVTSASADCPTGTFPTTCTNPSYHANGVIDLRNVDTAAPAKDGAGATLSYDKAAVALSAGAAANWNSGNATWRTQTSTALDPFCLNCHDSAGAAQISTFKLAAETLRTATDPFWDGTTNITNTYDQVNRGAVVDIKSRVTAGASSLDAPGEPRYDQAPVGDTIPDPPQGIYSRHAIRGQSLSVYATSVVTNYNQATVTWNDTSVMGCADCHTSDGANTTAGNAHGSDSEYLLKDASGGAAEGTLAGSSYVCYRCHALATYQPNGGHTGNAADFTDYTGLTGASRVPQGNTGGNIYAMACTNCHGGGYESQGDTTAQFGTIHGTSQTMNVGQDGGAGTRKAYRFMNGNSMRYFDPVNWSGSAYTCYTLSAKDTFGGCTKHAKGQGASRLQTRNLKY